MSPCQLKTANLNSHYFDKTILSDLLRGLTQILGTLFFKFSYLKIAELNENHKGFKV